MRLVDGKKPIRLEIIDADIACSVKNDPAHCAAAEAVRRLTNADDVRVFKTRAYVQVNGVWERYIVPPAIYREITAFDRGAAFEPGEYFLRAPAGVERLGRHETWTHRQRRVGKPSGKKMLKGTKTKNVREDGPRGFEIAIQYQVSKVGADSYEDHLPPHLRKTKTGSARSAK